MPMDKKIAFFGQFFEEKSVYSGAGNDFGMEKSGVKNRGIIGKNRQFFPDFSEMANFCRFFGI